MLNLTSDSTHHGQDMSSVLAIYKDHVALKGINAKTKRWCPFEESSHFNHIYKSARIYTISLVILKRVSRRMAEHSMQLGSTPLIARARVQCVYPPSVFSTTSAVNCDMRRRPSGSRVSN